MISGYESTGKSFEGYEGIGIGDLIKILPEFDKRPRACRNTVGEVMAIYEARFTNEVIAAIRTGKPTFSRENKIFYHIAWMPLVNATPQELRYWSAKVRQDLEFRMFEKAEPVHYFDLNDLGEDEDYE